MPTPYDTYTASPSPLNAVELAIADVRANGVSNWTYIGHLRAAARQLDLLQVWKDAKLLADLYRNTEGTENQYAELCAAERLALKNLNNS